MSFITFPQPKTGKVTVKISKQRYKVIMALKYVPTSTLCNLSLFESKATFWVGILAAITRKIHAANVYTLQMTQNASAVDLEMEVRWYSRDLRATILEK